MKRKRQTDRRRVYSYREFSILYPLCSAEERQRIEQELKQAERPNEIAGHPVPQDLNLVSYGLLDDLANYAKQGAQGALDCVCRVCGCTLDELTAANVFDVYGAIKWLNGEVERINNLFKRITPRYSAEEIQAGVKSLDFGSFGVLDWYAKRQGIADQNEVRDVAWVRIYTCMKNDNARAEYEKRLNRVYQMKYKQHR